MGVQYILERVSAKMGLNPAIPSERQSMLFFVNEGAAELYDQCDAPDMMKEEVFKVNGNQTVAFPAHLGQFRRVREFFSQIPWHVNNVRPRYNVANWIDMWRNYRIKFKQPNHTTVRNAAQVTFTVHAVENPAVVITVNGATPDGATVTETVTMDAVEKTTTNNWESFSAIRKDRVNQYDIAMTDVDGLEISKLFSNVIEAQYLIIDVSVFPFLNADVNQQAHYLEIMYKCSLPWLQDDGQEFPAMGYDNIIVNKALQLWYEEQGKPDLAVLYDQKATRSARRKLEDRDRSTEDCVAFAPNGHDSMLMPVRGRRSRYWNYSYGFYNGYAI